MKFKMVHIPATFSPAASLSEKKIQIDATKDFIACIWEGAFHSQLP